MENTPEMVFLASDTFDVRLSSEQQTPARQGLLKQS
jgi:hypothetical protein